jgi:hypothetical protein
VFSCIRVVHSEEVLGEGEGVFGNEGQEEGDN